MMKWLVPWLNTPEREDIDDEALLEAAWRMLAALENRRDAINGQGHVGEHDQVLADPYSSVMGPDVAVHDTVGDCARCGGAQYVADDLENAAWGDLREALGLERYRWQSEYPAEAFADRVAALQALP